LGAGLGVVVEQAVGVAVAQDLARARDDLAAA